MGQVIGVHVRPTGNRADGPSYVNVLKFPRNLRRSGVNANPQEKVTAHIGKFRSSIFDAG
jgi:hypothetical protein